MATLMDTEEEVGKDCRLHSSLLSVGHFWILPFVCMELAEALVYLQVVVWVFTELLLSHDQSVRP
jgi:hypothetical protein